MKLQVLLLICMAFLQRSYSSRIVRVIHPEVDLGDQPREQQSPHGGVTAFQHEFPFLVSFKMLSQNSVLHHYCSGALLNPRWVITRMLCSTRQPNGTVLVAGDHDIGMSEPTEQWRLLDRFVIHPNYTKSNGSLDLALVAPDRPFELNEFVSTVTLPEPGSIPSGGYVGIPGWGTVSADRHPVSSKLLKVFLPIMDPETCKKLLTPAYNPSKLCVFESDDQYYDEVERSFCLVDFGGPVVLANAILVGIVSGAPDVCFNPTEPLIVTAVASSTEWVRTVTATTGMAQGRDESGESTSSCSSKNVPKMSSALLAIVAVYGFFSVAVCSLDKSRRAQL